MIRDIKWVAQGDVAVEYTTDKGVDMIPFSAIAPYWDYANEDDFEGGRIYAMPDGKTIVLTMLTASDQGGIIAGWDTETKELVHISSGAYNVAVDVYEGYVYNLYMVHNYVTQPVMHLSRIPFGTKDAWGDDETIENFVFNHANEYSGSYEDVDLKVTSEGVTIRLGEKTYKC